MFNYLDKGLNERIQCEYTNLHPEVVFKIQMKVCEAIFVTCLFVLNISFIFQMKDESFFTLPASDHVQLPINSILLL